MDNFTNIFCFEPSKQHDAMPPGYKPDLNTSDLSNDAENSQYRKCIIEIQWFVALCQMISYILPLLSFDAAPFHTRVSLPRSRTYVATWINTPTLLTSSIQRCPPKKFLRQLKETGATYMLENLKTSFTRSLLLWANPSWYLFFSMQNSWLTWIRGYIKLLSLIFSIRLP